MKYYEGSEWLARGDYYEGRNGNGRVGICTFQHAKERRVSSFLSWFIADGAENELTASELTQDNLTPRWKEYLEKKGRKRADGTYDLSNLGFDREDPYGSSVLAV